MATDATKLCRLTAHLEMGKCTGKRFWNHGTEIFS